MATVLDNLREQRESLVSEIEGLMASDDFDPNDQTLVEARGRADTLDARIKSLIEFQQSRNAANAIDAIAVNAKHRQDEKREAEQVGGTMGDLFVRSRLLDQYTFRGTSPRAEVAFDLQTRAPLTEGAPPGSVFLPNPPQFTVPNGMESSPFLDSVGKLTLSSNSLDVITYGLITGADVVAEGAAKPEGSFTATSTPVTLQTVAVWVAATRQLLEDAVGLRGYLDTELRRSILRKVEALTGTAIDGGTYTEVPAASMLEGLRIAAGTVEMQGFSATTALLNPADLAQLDLGIWTGGNFGVPSGNTGAWGIRTIPVASIPAGTAYVGDFVTGVKLLTRNNVQIFVSDSVGDNFIKNIFVVLAEGRYKPVVVQPNAIVEVTVSGGALLSAPAAAKK